MATVFWTGNGQNIAQVIKLQVTAVAASGTLTATINGKNVVYTCTGTDTTTTAASNWLQLLANTSTAPPEFQQISWTNPSAGVINATARTPGRPFSGMTGGLTSAGGAGATVTQTQLQANVSNNDVGNAANWLRAGIQQLPQNGDDVVLQDSSVSLLYNLTALAGVQFATFTRWQNFTGTIGLPENNPAGYYEYLPTYFQFTGSGTLKITLGQGNQGTGPGRERYDVQAQATALVVLASGSPLDAYAVRFLGTNAANTVTIMSTSVGIGMLPAEQALIASASVEGGGTLALGPGVVFSGQITVDSSNAVLNCAPGTVLAQNNSTVRVESSGLTYAAVTGLNGSRFTWISNSTITTLLLSLSSTLDKSQDTRAMTITNSTIDADSCVINDPWSAITYTNATSCKNSSNSGPFIFGPNKTVKVT